MIKKNPCQIIDLCIQDIFNLMAENNFILKTINMPIR